jgi:WD40 repeat protein
MNSSVTLWNVRTQRTRVLRFPPPARGAPTNALAFSADGKRLAVGLQLVSPTTPGLLVLDVETGRAQTALRAGVDDVAFAPDGKHLAVAENPLQVRNSSIALLDAHTLRRTRTLAELPGVEATAVAFGPDGSDVAFGGADGTAGLVSVQTAQRIASYLGQTAAINQIAFSPDGGLVATASTDGTTRVWRAGGIERRQIVTGGVFGLQPVAGGVEAIVVRSDRPGNPLAVQTWSGQDAHPGLPMEIAPTNRVDAAFLSGDGRLAAVIPSPVLRPDAPVRIWSVAERRIVATVPLSNVPTGGLPVFSPDSSSIAMGIPAGIGVVGQPSQNAPPPPGSPGERPRAPMVLVDVHTGKTRQLGTTACGTGWRSQPFSRNGKLLAAGTFCGRVYVWELPSGRLVGHPLSIGGELARIAFSPDAARIAIASWNSTITIADVRTGHIAAVLTDHTRGVPDVAYSPDGRYLVSSSLDHTVRIWDAHTLRVLRVLDHPDPVYLVAFTPDSREVVTDDAAHVVRIWDACTACGDRTALLTLARSRVTRLLTAQERRTFQGQ